MTSVMLTTFIIYIWEVLTVQNYVNNLDLYILHILGNIYGQSNLGLYRDDNCSFLTRFNIIYLKGRNFGGKKIWRIWRFLPKTANLSSRQI